MLGGFLFLLKDASTWGSFLVSIPAVAEWMLPKGLGVGVATLRPQEGHSRSPTRRAMEAAAAAAEGLHCFR